MLWLLAHLIASAQADERLQAVDKAKEALYIQSGASAQVEKATTLASNEAAHYLSKVGVEKAAAGMIFIARSIRDKRVVIPTASMKVVLEPSYVGVEFPI